ncbi:MAG: LptA/OstA family protein [Halanaerobacter sp.]
MKNKLIIILVIVLSCGIIFSSPTNSQEAESELEQEEQQETESKQEDKEDEEDEEETQQESNRANLKADRVRYKKEEKVRIATGNVILDYKENHITSKELKMYNADNLLVFNDDVNLERPDETITSDYMEFKLDDDQLIAEENVVLNTTNNDKELYLTSEYLKLWTETDDILARQDVYMEYDGQKIRGEKLDYDAEEEKMTITKEAEIREDGEWIKSERIVVDLENDNIDAQGKVQMEFEF